MFPRIFRKSARSHFFSSSCSSSPPTPACSNPTSSSPPASSVPQPDPSKRSHPGGRSRFALDHQSLKIGLIQGGAELYDGFSTRYFVHRCRPCTEADPASRLLLGPRPNWTGMLVFGSLSRCDRLRHAIHALLLPQIHPPPRHHHATQHHRRPPDRRHRQSQLHPSATRAQMPALRTTRSNTRREGRVARTLTVKENVGAPSVSLTRGDFDFDS
jgi:hypothetical protein